MSILNQWTTGFLVGFALLGSTVSSADTFALDRSHTFATFRVMHLGISPVYGRFNDIAGTFDADAQGNLNSVSVTIKTTSIDTQIPARDTHLRGADFFLVSQHPTMTFVSSAVHPVSATESDVTGTLTMRGVAQTMTIRVVRTGLVDVPNPNGGLHIGAEAKFTIKRSEFGMTSFAAVVSDEIEVTLAVDGLRR